MLASGLVKESERLLEAMRAEFPGFRLVYKCESRLSRAIDIFLKLVTWGAQRQYLSHYHTVIGNTLYLPELWDEASDAERAIILRHERVHLLQRRRYGMPLFAFLYLVPILPLGLAWGRARLEWEAYTETLRATAELVGLDAVRSPELRKRVVTRFTGGAYGFMWPFEWQVQRWYDAVLSDIERARGARVGSTEHPPLSVDLEL